MRTIESSGSTATSTMGFAAYASAISLPATFDTSVYDAKLDDQFLQLLIQQGITTTPHYKPLPALVPAVSKGAPTISSTTALDTAYGSAVAPNPWRGDNSRVKPPFSYRSLVSQALQAAGRKGFTLREVYEWIEAQCPYYAMLTTQGNGASWRSSIRHNLVSHTEFTRATSEGSESGDESPDMGHSRGTGAKSFRVCRWTLSKEFRASGGRQLAQRSRSTTNINAVGPITSPPPSSIRLATTELGCIASLCNGMQAHSLSPAASSPADTPRPMHTSDTAMRRSASVPLVHVAGSWPAELPALHTLPEGFALGTMGDIQLPPLLTTNAMAYSNTPRGSASWHSSPVMTMPTQQPYEHVHGSPCLYPNPFTTGMAESSIKTEPYEHSPRRATAALCPLAGQYNTEIHDLALWLMDQ